ncbi:MAG: nicotinate-nucleotide adenylyltransferase [Clostridia bacterium]|nr:nicotinate-nucleotide adenylyltransferase [Clostridia bacterium]
MKTGILGGTFNPVHNGHIEMARAILESKIVDKILFVVAQNPPHKEGVNTDASHRFNMVSLVCDKITTFPSDIELNKQTNYTFDTLTLLSAQNPKDDFYFITGADMFLSLKNWYRGQELMKKFNFIAVERDGFFEDEKNKKLFEEISSLTNAHILKIKTPDISSTMIRKMVMQNRDITEFVPKKVADYIKNHGLYLGGE